MARRDSYSPDIFELPWSRYYNKEFPPLPPSPTRIVSLPPPPVNIASPPASPVQLVPVRPTTPIPTPAIFATPISSGIQCPAHHASALTDCVSCCCFDRPLDPRFYKSSKVIRPNNPTIASITNNLDISEDIFVEISCTSRMAVVETFQISKSQRVVSLGMGVISHHWYFYTDSGKFIDMGAAVGGSLVSQRVVSVLPTAAITAAETPTVAEIQTLPERIELVPRKFVDLEGGRIDLHSAIGRKFFATFIVGLLMRLWEAEGSHIFKALTWKKAQTGVEVEVEAGVQWVKRYALYLAFKYGYTWYLKFPASRRAVWEALLQKRVIASDIEAMRLKQDMLEAEVGLLKSKRDDSIDEVLALAERTERLEVASEETKKDIESLEVGSKEAKKDIESLKTRVSKAEKGYEALTAIEKGNSSINRKLDLLLTRSPTRHPTTTFTVNITPGRTPALRKDW